ncbi:MAG: glycine--tRNA ligase subunit beta [Thermodesulfobacteriota bacterium]
MKSETFLFEIGTEEIPAGYIDPALDMLSSLCREKLTAARIDHGQVSLFGTPRRLTVMIRDVAVKQTDVSETLTGPPVKAGIDASGNFTIPAHKFAEKAGVPVTALKTVSTDKGEYLAAHRLEKGRNTRDVLKEILPQILSAMVFPKNMKWGNQKELFARPVHSLLALMGKGLIKFSWAGVNSGRYSSGHPFMSSGRIKIDHPDQYAEKLLQDHVVADRQARKNIVLNEISRISSSLGGQVLPDSDLVDVVTNVVEFPVAASGRFDKKYLALPREVLVTAMRSHQKYFAVADSQNRLLPTFIVINNNQASDLTRVTRGHERVLRARLEDAMFFFEKDMRTPLTDRIDSLKRVLFQARLGSLHDKTERLKSLTQALTGMLMITDDALRSDLGRAAQLCKADLVTQMVIEFPKLQGTMGRVYALAGGENKIVAQAIEEHYQPAFSGAALPESPCGSLLAVVDKVDTICGCFAVGLIPSGASDPYALRRQGIGMIQILLSRNMPVSLSELITAAMRPYGAVEGAQPSEAAAEAVIAFLRGRMSQLLVDEGVPRDVVNAVLNASADRIPDVWNRARALFAMKSSPDFEPLAVAFKRVANIIKKTDVKHVGPVKEALFQHESETRLYTACRDTAGKVSSLLSQGLYDQALLEMAAVRPPVDRFFDDVLVMAEDPGLRNNRLALLLQVAGLFSGFADFSVIATDVKDK